jgi:hypothetical protein
MHQPFVLQVTKTGWQSAGDGGRKAVFGMTRGVIGGEYRMGVLTDSAATRLK